MHAIRKPITVEQVVDELKRRIEANRKQADEAKRWDWAKQQHVCERTIQELECIVYWITSSQRKDER